MAGWLADMERRTATPKAKGDRYFWIETYNGQARTFNRIGRGAGSIRLDPLLGPRIFRVLRLGPLRLSGWHRCRSE